MQASHCIHSSKSIHSLFGSQSKRSNKINTSLVPKTFLHSIGTHMRRTQLAQFSHQNWNCHCGWWNVPILLYIFHAVFHFMRWWDHHPRRDFAPAWLHHWWHHEAGRDFVRAWLHLWCHHKAWKNFFTPLRVFSKYTDWEPKRCLFYCYAWIVSQIMNELTLVDLDEWARWEACRGSHLLPRCVENVPDSMVVRPLHQWEPA